MNKEVKQKWIKALRSGRYKQTQGVLREKCNNDKDSFCCLGVLCNVLNRRKWKKDYNGYYSYDSYEDVVPLDVRKEIGLTESKQNKFLSLNDEENYNFKQIADYIEKKL